jgi:hypothetical protein
MTLRLHAALLALVLATAGLAGCIGSEGEDRAPTEADEPDETTDDGNARADSAAEDPSIRTETVNSSYTAEAYLFGLPTVTGDDSPRLSFEVPPDAAQVLVEYRWTATAASYELSLTAPDYCNDAGVDGPDVGGQDPATLLSCFAARSAGLGEDLYTADSDVPSDRGELSVSVGAEAIAGADCEEDACEWSTYAHAKAAAEVEFDLRVTIAPDEPLPDGYSAFG